MILEPTILAKLAEWRCDNGRETLLIDAPGKTWTASLALEACDRIGCAVWEVFLTRSTAVTDLRGWAERSVGRIAGLHEPLKLVELDVEKGVAQIRSSTPSQRGEQRAYYELLLHGRGAAEIRRYAAEATDTRRQQVAFNLTHEVLARLIEDVVAAA